MKIVTGYPPNYQLLKDFFNPPETTVFAYNGTIYNPQGGELHQDVIKHEEVHLKQQKQFATPDLWYTKYIYDKEFRLEQELEAYAVQLNFLSWLPYAVRREALNEFATALANDYKLDITVHEAESKIRNFAKRTVSVL